MQYLAYSYVYGQRIGCCKLTGITVDYIPYDEDGQIIANIDESTNREIDKWLKEYRDLKDENFAYWCREAGPAGPMLWAFNKLIKNLSK